MAIGILKTMNMTPWDNSARYDTTGDIVTGLIIGAVIGLILGLLGAFLSSQDEAPKPTKTPGTKILALAYMVTVTVMLGSMFGFIFGGGVSVRNSGDFEREKDQTLQTWMEEEYSVNLNTEDTLTLKYSLRSRTDLTVNIDGKLTNVHLVEADEGGALLATSESTLIEQK
jgi:hypothetical protein